MTPADWAQMPPWAGAVLAALVAGATAWLTSKLQNKGKPENALIDQLQEQQVAAAVRMASLEKRLAAFESRDMLYIPHIIRLNAHINTGLGPPAPRMPKAIREYLDHKDEEDDDA